MGVSSFPNCDPSFSLCAAFAEILGDLAFNPLMQGILFQANYFRDPLLLNSTGYQTYSQLAQATMKPAAQLEYSTLLLDEATASCS